MPARSSTSWAPTPASTTPAGCWTGSPGPTRSSSAAATPTERPPRPLPQGHRPRAGPQPARGARLSAPRRSRPSRDPHGRGRPASPRFLVNPLPPIHRNHRNHKNPRRTCFCGFCGFCGAWSESPMSGPRLAATEPGMAAMAPSPRISAVTLSNENGPSRSRPCPHPPPSAFSGDSPPWPAGEPLSGTGLDHRSGPVWPCAGIPRAGSHGEVAAEVVGGGRRWLR